MFIPIEWIPVASGVVGAAGAIFAQIVGGILTAGREKQAVLDRRADARAAAFIAEKRDLCVRALRAIDEQLKLYDSYFDGRLAAVAAGQQLEIQVQTGVFNSSRWDDMSAEVDLLIPDVVSKLNQCILEFRSLDGTTFGLDKTRYKAQRAQVRAKRGELRDEMRISLNVADPPKSAPNGSERRGPQRPAKRTDARRDQ